HTAARQFLEDQSRIKSRKSRPADILTHVDAAEPKAREFLQYAAIKPLLFPACGVGAELFARELTRGFDDQQLVFVQVCGHAAPLSSCAYSAAARPAHCRYCVVLRVGPPPKAR